jgi:hypothetical protein
MWPPRLALVVAAPPAADCHTAFTAPPVILA